jgi:hypothetical protein
MAADIREHLNKALMRISWRAESVYRSMLAAIYVAAGKSVGIAMGGYHYAQPGDPVPQVNRLVDRCGAYGALDLAPALDLEAPFVPGRARPTSRSRSCGRSRHEVMCRACTPTTRC